MTAYVLIETPVADAEILSERLWELPGILGIEELPADGSLVFRPDLAHHFVRFDGRQEFDDWLRTEQYRRGDRIRLKVYHTGAFPADIPVIGRGEVDAEDYLAPMRRQHHGRAIGPLWVGPPWEKPKAGKLPVLIEPGTAFGLGDHPTTQLCLELLPGIPAPQRVLDFGAGSGILAIAAARLFPESQLTLVELDRQCWSNIEHNFALNGLAAPVIHEVTPPGCYDLVLANVYLEVLKTVVLKLEGRRLLISGLLGAEQVADLPFDGFHVHRQLQRDDWFALDLGNLERPQGDA